MSFSGIEIARRALTAHQVRLSVAAHNIANTSTEGYSRQEVTLSPVGGTITGGSNRWLGGGVEVAASVRTSTCSPLSTEITAVGVPVGGEAQAERTRTKTNNFFMALLKISLSQSLLAWKSVPVMMLV